jgi:uncharacterized membrane protein
MQVDGPRRMGDGEVSGGGRGRRAGGGRTAGTSSLDSRRCCPQRVLYAIVLLAKALVGAVVRRMAARSERMNSGSQREPYIRTKNRNRSLSASGRRVFLVAVSFSIILFAGYAAALGAWLVLPFAGLEVLLVLWAFNAMRRHEQDYERLEISPGAGRFEARDAAKVSAVEFNPDWAQVVCNQSGWRCDLALRVRGRQVSIGRLMSDEERLDWVQELRSRIRVVRA